MQLVSAVLTAAAAMAVSALPQTPKAAAGQSIVCYDRADCSGGKYITFSQNVYDLTGYSFDNRISCCVFNGVWILYEDAFFNAAVGPQVRMDFPKPGKQELIQYYSVPHKCLLGYRKYCLERTEKSHHLGTIRYCSFA
jgi:hypothetical protein